MDWFFGNDPRHADEARNRLLVAQAVTAFTLLAGLISFGIYLNYESGIMLVFGALCLTVCSMSYAHALEFRRVLLDLGGSPTLTTEDFPVKSE